MDGFVYVRTEDLEKIENEVLRNKQQYLVTHVKPDDILDALVQNKLVGNFADQKYSLPTNTVSDKVQIILDELRRSRPGYLKEFCTILKESRTQDHIVAELQKEFKIVSEKYGYHSANGDVATARTGAAVNNTGVGYTQASGRKDNCGTREKTVSVGERAQQCRPVQIKNFPSLYSELQQGGIAKWREIGTQFGFELYELDAISAGQSDDSEANMTKVFELWKQQSLKQTWLDVIEAVSATGHNPQLCEDLRETYQAELHKEAKLKDLSNDVLLPMADCWYELGLSLGIDEQQLGLVTQNYNTKFFREMLQNWWQQNLSKDRTWNKVVQALDKARLHKLANSIYDSKLDQK